MNANPSQPQLEAQASPDTEQGSEQTLPRVLSSFDAITMVIGSIIGSGIFFKANVIASELGNFSSIIAVWIVIGLVTLFGALALGELAAMLPHAGGPYVYLREAYGRLPAFLWGWTEFWIIRTGSLGSLACATAMAGNNYLSHSVPPWVEAGYLPEALGSWFPLGTFPLAIITIGMVCLLSLVNVIGTRWGAWTQNLTTVIKVGFLLFLIGAPFALAKIDTANLAPMWPQDFSVNLWRGLGVAAIAVLWPYDGWINIGPVAEEIRDPQRNVPRALAIGMFVVIMVYVGVNCSYHLVLPMPKIMADKNVAENVSRVVSPNWGSHLAAIGIMISTFGALNSNLLAGPRIYFAMARDNLFPKTMRHVHPNFQTPANAIIAQAGWSIVLIIVAFVWKPDPGDAFDALTDFVVFGGSIFYAMAVGAVFVLRMKRPDLARPYRTWGYPVTPALYLLTFTGVLLTMLFEKWQQTAAGSLLILAGVFFFWFWTRKEK